MDKTVTNQIKSDAVANDAMILVSITLLIVAIGVVAWIGRDRIRKWLER